jgi:hypothetical protein
MEWKKGVNIINIIFYGMEKGGEHHRYHILCNGKGGEHHRYHILCNGKGMNIIDIMFYVMEKG